MMTMTDEGRMKITETNESERPVRVIEISSHMYELIEKRNRRIAEVQFQQCTIDMPPENAAKIKDALIERLIERLWERIGDAAGAHLDRRNPNALAEAAEALREQKQGSDRRLGK
jgi:hypothetical protein